MFGIQHSVSVFDNEQGLNTSASSVMNDNSGMTQQSHDANHKNQRKFNQGLHIIIHHLKIIILVVNNGNMHQILNNFVIQ
jgi:hypothetical protein